MRCVSALPGVQNRTTVLTVVLITLNLFLLFILVDMRRKVRTAADVMDMFPEERCQHLASEREAAIRANPDLIFEKPTMEKSLTTQIALADPFYVHYVRFKPDDQQNITLRFLDYLSILSAVNRLKPDGILLHGDVEPVGKYWDEVKSRGWVKHVNRQKIVELHGRIKKPAQLYHMADFIKLDILKEYGGVAVDFDVYFVRGERIKTILSQHTALTCYGDKDGYSIGFIGFSKDSRMLHAWRRSYDVIYSPDWNFNSGDVQKYLSEVFSEEVYVANYVCNNQHPYHLTEFYHETGKCNWTDSLAIHTYSRFSGLPEIKGPEDLLPTNASSYKELLSNVYENGVLPEPTPSFNDRVDPLAGVNY